MSILSQELQDRDKGESKYTNVEELQEHSWQFVSAEIVKANNPKFGATEDDGLFKNGVLQEGETIRYILISDEGKEKVYDSKGMAFYIAVKKFDPQPGQEYRISKTGKMEDTKYEITKV